MENRKHYAAAILAFIIWGFFSLPLRALKEFSAGNILYFRILFSAALLAVIITGFKRESVQQTWAQLQAMNKSSRNTLIGLTILGGALLTVNWLTFIYIVNNINIKTASFSYLICPVITAVLGFIILKEKLASLQWLAVMFCAISCVLIGFHSTLELGYSFLTALTYAFYLITQRKNQGFDRIIVLGVQITFALFVLTCIFPLLVHEVPTQLNFFTIIALIAALFTVLPLFLNLFALNKINSATIGIMMYINPLFNFTLAFLVFDESITTIQMLGYCIILIALVMFNYPVFKRMKTALATR